MIVKRCKDHENLLKRPHNKPKTKHGIGYADMDKATAGDPMEWICPQCMTPRPEVDLPLLQIQIPPHPSFAAYSPYDGGWSGVDSPF